MKDDIEEIARKYYLENNPNIFDNNNYDVNQNQVIEDNIEEDIYQENIITEENLSFVKDNKDQYIEDNNYLKQQVNLLKKSNQNLLKNKKKSNKVIKVNLQNNKNLKKPFDNSISTNKPKFISRYKSELNENLYSKNKKTNSLDRKFKELVISNKEKVKVYSNHNMFLEDMENLCKNKKDNISTNINIKFNNNSLKNNHTNANEQLINKYKKNNYLNFDFEKHDLIVKSLEQQIQKEREEQLKIQINYNLKLQEFNDKKIKTAKYKSYSSSKIKNKRNVNNNNKYNYKNPSTKKLNNINKKTKSTCLFRKSKHNSRYSNSLNKFILNTKEKIKNLNYSKNLDNIINKEIVNSAVDKIVDNIYNKNINKNNRYILNSTNEKIQEDRQLDMNFLNKKEIDLVKESNVNQNKENSLENNQLKLKCSNSINSIQSNNPSKINLNIEKDKLEFKLNSSCTILKNNNSNNQDFIKKVENFIKNYKEKDILSSKDSAENNIIDYFLDEIISEEINELNKIEKIKQNTQLLSDKIYYVNAYYKQFKDLKYIEKEIELKLKENYNVNLLKHINYKILQNERYCIGKTMQHSTKNYIVNNNSSNKYYALYIKPLNKKVLEYKNIYQKEYKSKCLYNGNDIEKSLTKPLVCDILDKLLDEEIFNVFNELNIITSNLINNVSIDLEIKNI